MFLLKLKKHVNQFWLHGCTLVWLSNYRWTAEGSQILLLTQISPKFQGKCETFLDVWIQIGIYFLFFSHVWKHSEALQKFWINTHVQWPFQCREEKGVSEPIDRAKKLLHWSQSLKLRFGRKRCEEWQKLFNELVKNSGITICGQCDQTKVRFQSDF